MIAEVSVHSKVLIIQNSLAIYTKSITVLIHTIIYKKILPMNTSSLLRLSSFLQSISTDELPALLEDLLTPSEINEITERIELLRQLKTGKTQREIASEMGISVTTVSRGNRVLQHGKGIIKKYV